MVACLPVQIQTVILATIWYVHCCTTILVSTNDSPNRATHPGLKLVQQITLTCKLTIIFTSVHNLCSVNLL